MSGPMAPPMGGRGRGGGGGPLRGPGGVMPLQMTSARTGVIPGAGPGNIPYRNMYKTSPGGIPFPPSRPANLGTALPKSGQTQRTPGPRVQKAYTGPGAKKLKSDQQAVAQTMADAAARKKYISEPTDPNFPQGRPSEPTDPWMQGKSATIPGAPSTAPAYDFKKHPPGAPLPPGVVPPRQSGERTRDLYPDEFPPDAPPVAGPPPYMMADILARLMGEGPEAEAAPPNPEGPTQRAVVPPAVAPPPPITRPLQPPTPQAPTGMQARREEINRQNQANIPPAPVQTHPMARPQIPITPQVLQQIYGPQMPLPTTGVPYGPDRMTIRPRPEAPPPLQVPQTNTPYQDFRRNFPDFPKYDPRADAEDDDDEEANP